MLLGDKKSAQLILAVKRFLWTRLLMVPWWSIHYQSSTKLHEGWYFQLCVSVILFTQGRFSMWPLSVMSFVSRISHGDPIPSPCTDRPLHPFSPPSNMDYQQASSSHWTEMPSCYRPQTKLREGNVFTPVCKSFCSDEGNVSQHAMGMEVCTSTCNKGCLPVGADTWPGQTPPRRTNEAGGTYPTGIHSCSVLCASLSSG